MCFADVLLESTHNLVFVKYKEKYKYSQLSLSGNTSRYPYLDISDF